MAAAARVVQPMLGRPFLPLYVQKLVIGAGDLKNLEVQFSGGSGDGDAVAGLLTHEGAADGRLVRDLEA